VPVHVVVDDLVGAHQVDGRRGGVHARARVLQGVPHVRRSVRFGAERALARIPAGRRERRVRALRARGIRAGYQGVRAGDYSGYCVRFLRAHRAREGEATHAPRERRRAQVGIDREVRLRRVHKSVWGGGREVAT